jgi:hypothetical protein
MLILATAQPRQHPAPDAAPSVAQSEPAQPAAPATPAPGVAPERPTAPAHVVAAVRPRAGGPDRAVAAASFEAPLNTAGDVEPLRQLASIQVAPVSHTLIAPAELAIRPLNSIDEVQIAPLNPPDRRN